MAEQNQKEHLFQFDRSLFHKASLLPFFAFVGLGRTCYPHPAMDRKRAILS